MSTQAYCTQIEHKGTWQKKHYTRHTVHYVMYTGAQDNEAIYTDITHCILQHSTQTHYFDKRQRTLYIEALYTVCTPHTRCTQAQYIDIQYGKEHYTVRHCTYSTLNTDPLCTKITIHRTTMYQNQCTQACCAPKSPYTGALYSKVE